MSGLGSTGFIRFGSVSAGTPKKPNAPLNLSASANPNALNRKRVSLSWNPPVDTGFPIITSYTLEIVGVETITGITTTSTTWSNGETNSSYTFKVYAVNINGTGPSSNSVNATVQDVADAPTSFSVDNSNIGYNVLTWSPPTYVGSSSISSYIVYIDGVLDGKRTSPYTHYGISGTTYSYYIVANNDNGEGVPTQTISKQML